MNMYIYIYVYVFIYTYSILVVTDIQDSYSYICLTTKEADCPAYLWVDLPRDRRAEAMVSE